MKLFALVQMQGGSPNLSDLPYTGFVLCDSVGNWGAYLISGTGAQLTAINALPQVIGICSVTEGGVTRWAELDGTITLAIRTRLNNWKDANRPAWPNIPAGATYRQVLTALFKRFNDKFDMQSIDVSD